MGKFLYSGPVSAATLDDGTDVILFPGREITLPDGNAWVQTLVAQKRLTPVAAPAKPAAKPAAEAIPAAEPTRTTTQSKTKTDSPAAGEKEGK